MSDTPRTDAVFDDCEDSCGNPWEAVSADFARQLERELAAAKDLAESNGKLAHDLAIKCEELRNQLNFLSDQFLTKQKEP
jgi:hypothetical protein